MFQSFIARSLGVNRVNLNRGLLSIALPLMISSIVNSQAIPLDYKQMLKMPEVSPPSPEAASLGKFGNIPVSYATGVPNISIPIWEVKCGGLSWPISLSYHAGGIRVDEIASSAGLGWAVNAPGVITRNLVGRPDDETSGEPTYNSVGSADWLYLYDVADGKADSEFDVFSYNFNGRSGKFIIKQDGSVLQIPLTNLKITFASSFNSFTITDESGITYLFDQTELTTSRNIAANVPDILYKSSWYLSRVELPDKNNIIQFTYSSSGSSSQIAKNFHQAIGQKYVAQQQQSGGYNEPLLLPINNTITTSGSSLETDIAKLTSISFPNGSISFSYSSTVRQDVAAYNRLTAITINRVVNNKISQVKKFDFYHSYFHNNPGGGSSSAIHYRLRLDSLGESGATSYTEAKKYKFQYNSTNIAPRESYAQDMWGYNNGQNSNTSLLQSESVVFNDGSSNQTYSIGNSNRNVDTNAMKACMLSSITYPTGGKTVFTFEPHVYNTEEVLTSSAEQVAQITGSQSAPQVVTTNFTFPTNTTSELPRIKVFISKYNYPNVDFPSRVTLRDPTTGVEIYSMVHNNPYQDLNIDQAEWLEPGRNYELKAYVYTSASVPQISASIKVSWKTYTNTPDIQKGGGLRIKEIKNYVADGVLAGSETYIYDTAITLTPFYHIKRKFSEQTYRLGDAVFGSSFCNYYYTSPTCRMYSSASVYPLSTAMGSPMLYQKVQRIIYDVASGWVNGKSVYQYDIVRDETYPIGGRYVIPPLISNDWKNGFLVSESHYKINNGVYSLVKKIENKYTDYNSTEAYALRVQSTSLEEGCKNRSSGSLGSDVLYSTYPVRTGSRRLFEKIETLYDDNQNKIETHVYNEYASLKYDFPTRTSTINSKGTSDSVAYKRSPDFASPGNVYEKMETRNIIAPVIQQIAYSGAVVLNTVRNNYRDWYGDGKILAIDTVQASTLNNSLERRLQFNGYDTYNNPLSVNKPSDINMSYLYGYKKTLPIAEIINADSSSVAYTSFETGEGGGWSGILRAGFAHNGSITGRLAYSKSGFSFSKSGLSTSATYIVTYWSKSGSYSVNSTSASSIKTVGSWTLYQHTVINPSGGTITVAGSGTIDELRLYPSNAHIKTYTYDPMAGVTSECDIKDLIQYYFYDTQARLLMIKDDNGNILKQFCYNYAGQSGTCTLYGNGAYSTSYTKNDCSSGTGSSETYIVPANTYYAPTATEALQLAINDAAANGQDYANFVGGCTSSTATVYGTNSVNDYYTVTLTNTATSQVYNMSLYPNNGSANVVVPAGTYNVQITPYYGGNSAYFSLGSYWWTGLSGAYFTGVSITSTSYLEIGPF